MRHWFLPHHQTHAKAKLISWEGILIYILLFMMLQVSFSLTGYFKPGVLGTTSNIEYKKVIELTNIEREKVGLSPVIENEALNKAAQAKAANMFEENYWAHFAPSGKSPWDFILGAGYKFTFAGENLAKNFSEDTDVVEAWMASPSHRENLLNPKYRDIGIAVVEGVLNGQKTTLVVQEFGNTSALAAATPQVSVSGQEIELSKSEYNKRILLSSGEESKEILPSKSLIDPYQVSKNLGLVVIFFISFLLVLDLIVLRRRGVLRISSHHGAHFALLSLAAAALMNINPGQIL